MPLPAPGPGQHVLVIADAHLPLDDRRGADAELNAMLALIEQHRPGLSALVLLGDTFDFWFEWRFVIPTRAFPLLALLHRLRQEGVEVHIFAGNHDFYLGRALREQVGATLHPDEWVVNLGDQRYYFHHGDGFAASDVGYRRLKAVLRNKMAQEAFRTIIHPDLAMGIGRIASAAGGEKLSTEQGPDVLYPEYVTAARRILRQGHDVVMIGHMHQAVDETLPEGRFINPGPFLAERRYGLIEGVEPVSRIWS